MIALIEGAQRRLAVIAPALTTRVAQALAGRMADLDTLSLTVILDADAEVYRMGYGDPPGLEIIRNAANAAMFGLREQPGVRIGVLISDDLTMIYAPVSRNVEAGSTTEEKPNAVMLSGGPVDRLAGAAGTSDGEREIGALGMEPRRVEAMVDELKRNSPTSFDLTRKLKVFTSEVEFVELKVSNYKLSRRRVALPVEFVGVDNVALRERISGQIRAPLDGIGVQKIMVRTDGQEEQLSVDECFIEQERKEIENDFTYVLPKKGRVILKRDRDDFDKQIRRFKEIVTKYQEALKLSVDNACDGFRNQLVNEFAERWTSNPPGFLSRRSGGSGPDRIRNEIITRADKLFSQIVAFASPEVILNYKAIVIEDIEDPEFRETLRAAMKKANVDNVTLERLFEIGDAAAAQGAFEQK
jgi:hypothetical protein